MITTLIQTRWDYVADGVMGGMSTGGMVQEMYQDRSATVLRGQVSLDNNGGFVQIATDLPAGSVDAGWDGIMLDVAGNGQTYDLRLRTAQLARPWQSFRADFTAPANWTTIRLPFAGFSAHKHDLPFDARSLRRIGVLAIGRVFDAEIAVAAVGLYRE